MIGSTLSVIKKSLQSTSKEAKGYDLPLRQRIFLMFRSLLELLSTAEVLLVPYIDLSMCSCNGHRESLEIFALPCIGP